eukprot:scaffold499_cov335-Pavlova_lutheri.AAC.14
MNRINTWLSHGQIPQWSLDVILTAAEGNENTTTTFLNVPPNGLEHRGDTDARANERERTPTPPPALPAHRGRRRSAPTRHN